MDKKSMWTKLCLHVLFISTCHGLYAGKRAVPNGDSNPHSNSNIVEGGNSAVPVTNQSFVDFWLEKNGGLCPPGQINQRNNTVCCWPVSCGRGHEVLPCLVNETRDSCKSCDPGFIQVNYVSSLNMLTATCFLEESEHHDCPVDDMKPSRENLGHNFPKPCACKNEDCYYPYYDVGSCHRSIEGCGEGKQMNLSGDCVPCEWYSYKNTTGCEPCTQVDSWLRYGRPDGNYVPPTTTQTTTTTTEKSTVSETSLEVVRTDENREKLDNSEKNYTLIIIIVISCVVFILVIVVFGMLVTRWKKCWKKCRGQHPIETQRPLLTTNTSEPVTPISVNGLGNGGLQNGLYHPIGASQTQNGQYIITAPQQNGQSLQNGILQNGILRTNGQIGQNVDHMHVGAVGNTYAKQIASNGSSQNGRIMNNPDHHDLQLISTSSKPCASKKFENEENQGKDKANHSLNDKEIMGASAGSSNKGIMTEEETAVKQRPPSNIISIHGNKFENCQIYFPSKKARDKDVSGSFGMDSSLESEVNHPIGQHHTTGSTMIQPGRRDGYLINGDNQPGHNNQERADGNCRSEYGRTPFEHARFQEAPAGRVFHEDVAMETLDKPNYPCDTVDIDTDITEMARNNVATVSGLDRPRANNVATVSGLNRPRADRVQQIQPTRRIATVAPMCATTVQSVRHTSGYPSGGINVSDESASCTGTSMSTGYRLAGIGDIADTGDFSTASDQSEASQNDGMDVEDTARKREAMNEQPPVHHVTPLCRRESPDGDSGSHNDNRQTVGLDIDENTSEKVVAADETDVKQYVDRSYPNTDEGMTDSHDSESDLKKPNEEQLMELKNANEKFHDNEKDLNCDNRHIEGISNAAVNIPDSNENECVTVSESHVTSELTENGGLNDPEEESFEIDNDVGFLPTPPNDDSYEIDDNVDIDAIHRENQHAQDITCRGETYDELNSVQSGYKGFTPM